MKFAWIAKRLERISAKKRVDNAKLSSLIFAFNRVQFELDEINKFWRDISGWNVLYFLALNVQLAFVAIHVDLRLQVVLFTIIIVMYLTCVYGIFAVANRVPAEVSNAGKVLFGSIRLDKLDALFLDLQSDP